MHGLLRPFKSSVRVARAGGLSRAQIVAEQRVHLLAYVGLALAEQVRGLLNQRVRLLHQLLLLTGLRVTQIPKRNALRHLGRKHSLVDRGLLRVLLVVGLPAFDDPAALALPAALVVDVSTVRAVPVALRGVLGSRWGYCPAGFGCFGVYEHVLHVR